MSLPPTAVVCPQSSRPWGPALVCWTASALRSSPLLLTTCEEEQHWMSSSLSAADHQSDGGPATPSAVVSEHEDHVPCPDPDMQMEDWSHTSEN